MNIFASSIATETNTFSPIPTTWNSFLEGGISYGKVREDNVFLLPIVEVWRRRAAEDGHCLHEGFFAFAQPAGRSTGATYRRLKAELLASLIAAGPVDIVLLLLHGAMVAEGCDDCEGDILRAVREIVGPAATIGVELDPHCHLSEAMVQAADLLILFKEYPHTDAAPRADELYTLCERAALGEIAPVSVLVDCRMIGFYPTTAEPMANIVRMARQAESIEGVLSVSIAHGFPWADVADVGTRVLAIADGRRDLAASTAAQLAGCLYRYREDLLPRPLSMARILRLPTNSAHPLFIADAADNPGGGAPGDNTAVLQRLLAEGIRDAVLGCIWDPMAVQVCASAGVGARLQIRLGGKTGRASGAPLDLVVTVGGISAAHSQPFGGHEDPLGAAVWLACEGIDIVVISRRTQTLSPSAFTRLGVELNNKTRIVVKSAHHYFAEFSTLSRRTVVAETDGALSMNFAALPYTERDGNFFPRVADPLNARASFTGDPSCCT
ncbi:M81 family metallopeptidase [Massilia cavernae]|uniref:Microcystinase C n=1 Tax=Massilia cavernae TaxID=2320864 RepID=A0A418XRX3_9BURK|nr:M81 family metallopeptidase [Massilia cavernae]RJG15291.1 M81 family peptidase [Massilia cavernae]